MKIILFGAGNVGIALAEAFSKSDIIKRVMVCDRRGTVLDELSQKVASSKVKTLKISIEQESQLRSVMSSYDVLINALPQRFAPKLTKLALNSGLHYIDLGGNQVTLDKQEELHNLGVQKKRWILPNCGFAPGLANILAMDLVNELDHVDELSIRSGCLPLKPIPPFNYQLVVGADALLSEYYEDQWGLENGQMVQRENLEGYQSLRFQSQETPLPLEAFYTGNRINSLAKQLEGKVQKLTYQAIRYQGHRDIIKAIQVLGFQKPNIFDVRSQLTFRSLLERQMERTMSHHAADMSLLQIEAKGTVNGQAKKACLELTYHQRGDGYISSLVEITALATCIITQQAAQMPTEKIGGFHAPEEVIDAKAFIQALKASDIQLNRFECN